MLLVGFDPYADVGYLDLSDTGSFLGKIAGTVGGAVKSVAKGAVSAARTVASTAQKVTANPVAQVLLGPAAMGTNTAASYGRQVLSGDFKGTLNAAIPLAQQALKNAGPAGMVASGALSAMQAGLQGKNLAEIGLAAATGAAPEGIARALSVGQRLLRGDNVLAVAISEAGKQFTPGSPEAAAFNIGANILKTAVKSGNPKEVLAAARRSLISEAQRRAFDVAVGTVARAGVNSAPVASAIAVGKRVGDFGNVLPAAVRRREVQVIHPDLSRAVTALRRTPVLQQQPVATIAKQIGVSPMMVQRARSMGGAGLSWRPLSRNATTLVRSRAPFAALRALTDTRGLSPDGLVYVVEKGDAPGKIALKLTGKESNWPQLIAANPQKKTTATNIGKVFATLVAGEKLKVPASWQRPVAVTTPATIPSSPSSPSSPISLPSSPGVPQIPAGVPAIPVVDPQRANTAAILQGKALLVTWSKTDGMRVAGFEDYGTRAEDMAPSWGQRDIFMLKSFQDWSNRTRGTQLATDGNLDESALGSLRTWAEERVAVPLPQPPGPANDPVVVVSTPPSSTPPSSAPATPPPASGTVIDLPDMTVTDPGPKAPAAPADSGANWGLILAAAAAGGLVAGPLGAAVGAGAGVVLS